MTSIRARTTLLVAATMTLLLALGGATLYLIVRAALTRQFDDGLTARSQALQSLTKFEGGKVEVDISADIITRYQQSTPQQDYIAWAKKDNTWQALAWSESLSSKTWPEAPTTPPAPGIADLDLPDDIDGRALTVEFHPITELEGEGENAVAPSSSSPLVRLMVAQSRENLDLTLRTIASSIAAVGISLIAAAIIATRLSIMRGTKPLSTLSESVATLGPSTLDHRLPTDSLPAELAPIATRLNDLLSRLSEAFAREKRFTDAASHELRTPIAELRMLLEVALLQPRSPEQWSQSARDGLTVLSRAQQLTESLLQLSRATASKPTTDASTDLVAILREESARALSAGNHNSSLVQIDTPASLKARIAPPLARSIIANLLSNALRHGDLSHTIRCGASEESGAHQVSISNHAPSLTPADIPHLFEPFWRKDPWRGQEEGQGERGGFGLGLAVSRALAESAGGTLTCELDANNDLRMTLRIPST